MDLKLHLRRSGDPGHFSTVAPFVVILVALAALSLWELKFQDGGRVFIIGENLWADAEKRAAVCLMSYADTRSPDDMKCFRAEADALLGDMQARIALDSSAQSYAVIRDGLVRGRNRPEDVPNAITFYNIAPWNPGAKKAVNIWRESDHYISGLIVIANRLESTKDPGEIGALKRQLVDLDFAMNGEERMFAADLSEGMHFLAMSLCFVQGVAALMLIGLAVVVGRRMMAVRKHAEEQVHLLAYYDKLTQLPNRTLLGDLLTSTLTSAGAANKSVAILFVDLDRFKNINDSLGHSVGDQVLQEAAERIKQCVRDEDIVARIGGDEFLIALPKLEGKTEAAAAADRLLRRMAVSIPSHGRLFTISCSIGISMFPEHGADYETLIRKADAAMYCAKEDGRNRYRFFTEEMNVAVSEQLTVENGLRSALENGEFYLEYQPQICIATGEVNGLEALLRWKHPEIGLIAPSTFIRVAENSGLILPIGEWVLRTACRQARRWREEHALDLPIAVNVSAVQFRQEGFCEVIRKILLETGVAPRSLELELTESLLLSNEDVMFEVLRELKAMGVRLAIDDFGTGYSSLSYLRQFPVSKLKIDRSFIRDVAANADDAAITTAIISMGRNLNLRVIAEGVETEEQLSFLRARRCDDVQGYYLSRPLPSDLVPGRLSELQFPISGLPSDPATRVQ